MISATVRRARYCAGRQVKQKPASGHQGNFTPGIRLDSSLSSGLHRENRQVHGQTASGGVFISEDPLGFDGGDINLFAYVKNNPINDIDPDGLQAMTVTPYGPLPLYLPNVPVHLTPSQSIQMQEDLAYLARLFNPLPLLDWAGAQIAGTCEMAKGERGWGKKRGDDPLWDKSIKDLKEIERKSPDPAERERAKKIRKMKEKQRGMPNN